MYIICVYYVYYICILCLLLYTLYIIYICIFVCGTLHMHNPYAMLIHPSIDHREREKIINHTFYSYIHIRFLLLNVRLDETLLGICFNAIFRGCPEVY